MRKRVLLVSEDPAFFDAPENAFQTRGCDVFTAMGGDEAFDFLASHDVDLILSRGVPGNVSAPDLDEKRRDIPVVLITPAGQKGGLSVYSSLPGIHVLDEPVTGKALLKLSSQLLRTDDRKFLSILVQVRITKPKATTVFGKSRDLSVSGLLVETNQTLLMHDQVVVSFLIPGAERMIQTQALVMREAPRPAGSRRYGLQFLALSDEDTEIIRAFLAGRLAS